ncbi:putative HD superfamily hydrolase involved in NAD metabolism [Anaerosolibacter carboniphilus]|uniref:Putative HD superfamily hydrolase involved in NAD metabolism n=1 Tax=Anaerosolibacter carboniphilus TaxID=1417629 RepID=A0A841KYL0_9FIRM|nr:HD domain-containing protein [Anaerosolibacter carboniphilus]MBB6217050.1 putative HD superfamily hydrolase involved in NAD metabolism [Anaerosolibacter carboniphilus]
MKNYLDFQITMNLQKDVEGYFLLHGRQDTYEHTLDVVETLYNIEQQFGSIEPGSKIACYCHDLGRVVKNDEMIRFCIQHDIDISDEEKLLPSILHQKISCYLAEKVFGIKDILILNAIKYHTTSRKSPSVIEMEVFLADKMSWKENEYKELVSDLKEALTHSKENAMLYYLSTLENNKEKMRLYHSDSREAFLYFYQNTSTRNV